MSAHAWSILGIAPTEDVRAIKRAYSARLKSCRPEDDAEGFARLRTAYEMLLARAERMARQRAAQATRDVEATQATTSEEAPPVQVAAEPAPLPQVAAESVSPPQVAVEPAPLPQVSVEPASPPQVTAEPAPPPQVAIKPAPPPAPVAVVPPRPVAVQAPGPTLATPPPTYTPQALAAEVIAQANQHKPSRGLGMLGFTRWLADHPALVSLQLKQATGHAVLAALAGGANVPQPAVRALSEFFGWDDRLEQRRLAQAGLSLDAVTAQLESVDLQQWVKNGLARKDLQVRRLERIRRAGDRGVRAWWLALTRVERFRPLLTLNHALKHHSYRSVEQHIGAPTMRFWQGMYAQVPNRAQWLRGIGQPLLLGVLCMMLLWPLFMLRQQNEAGVDWLAAGSSVAGITLFLMVWNSARLAGRWIQFGVPPAWRARVASSRRWLGFAPLHWRLLPMACALLVPAWYWPASWPAWPYGVVMSLLLVLQARTGWSVLMGLLVSVCAVAILGSMLDGQRAQTLAYWLTLPTACLINYVHHAQARRAARPAVRSKGRFSWQTMLVILWLLGILLRGLAH